MVSDAVLLGLGASMVRFPVRGSLQGHLGCLGWVAAGAAARKLPANFGSLLPVALQDGSRLSTIAGLNLLPCRRVGQDIRLAPASPKHQKCPAMLCDRSRRSAA